MSLSSFLLRSMCTSEVVLINKMLQIEKYLQHTCSPLFTIIESSNKQMRFRPAFTF